MIDYICKPYRFTIGIVSYFMMLVFTIDFLMLVNYVVNDRIERSLAFGLLALFLAAFFMSYFGILMSQRYFHFMDEGIYLFDKHKRRYNKFYKWSDFPKVYVFYHYRSYRIIFTTEELNSEEQISCVWKSHKLNPFLKDYDGFIISTFEVDKKLDQILKEKYGIGYRK